MGATEVQERKSTLIREAQITLDAIRQQAAGGVADPLVDPPTLARAVTSGILDAPQLQNNPFARGHIRTRLVGGACQAVDPAGRLISEEERLAGLT
jgi:hypothetical protein